MKQLCRVGLVGRPNVGKSTLFNRLVGSRLAVVAADAGTTRDRLERTMEEGELSYVLFDMAGIEPELEKTELNQAVQSQVERSLKMADILVWVVDSRAGADAIDDRLSRTLRNLGRPIILAINKHDDPKHDMGQYEFSQYGIDPMIALSALHDRGVRQLREDILAAVKICQETKAEGALAEDPDRELRLALVGRPNVGKSTLLNKLVDDTRSVVSAEPGTTRDAVDTIIPAQELFGRTFTKWQQVRIIDTAGIRRRGKIGHQVEAWSVLRTLDAVDQAEVVLFMIDAEEGLVSQDLQVVQKVVDAGRAFILLVNKWDAVLAKKDLFLGTEEEQEAQEKFLDQIRNQAPFLHWARVLFLSATEGQNLEYIGRLVLAAYQAWDLKISQDDLDELTGYLRKMPRLKNLQKIVMTHNRPPVFHIHTEGRNLVHFSTNRYIENALRDRFGIGSTPIKIWGVPSVEKKR